MKKKLVIKFWKAEKALAMQIIEQEGLPKRKENNKICIISSPFITRDGFALRGNSKEEDLSVSHRSFESNQERDEHLNKSTQAITDELFTGTGELKVGEYCEVRNYEGYTWEKLKLLAILPNIQTYKYVCEARDDNTRSYCYAQARPINKRTEPKVETNGEITTYTWEEE